MLRGTSFLCNISLVVLPQEDERGQFVEPLRRTQSANPPSQYDESFVRKLSPLRAPTLMLVNGLGEESILLQLSADTPTMNHFPRTLNHLFSPSVTRKAFRAKSIRFSN